jgi:penicillin amidase
LNLGYADKEGNIGYMLAGTYPKRKRGHTGAFAVLGTGQWDWQGFAEDEEKPSAFNMEKGYFVETNFRVVPVGFPHVLGGDYGSYQRQKRAIEIIEQALATSGPTLTTDLLKQIQLDSKSLYFVDSLKKSVLPLIVNSIDPSNAQLLNKLLNWDGVFRYGAVEPTLSEGMRL